MSYKVYQKEYKIKFSFQNYEKLHYFIGGNYETTKHCKYRDEG